MASSEAGYRTHRPQARTGEEASAGRNESRSPRLVAQDGEQSKLVLPSSSLCPRCPGVWVGGGGLHTGRSFSQTLTFIARGRVVPPAPGCRSASPPAAARRHVALRVSEHGRWRAGRALLRIASATGPAGRGSRGGGPGMSTYLCCRRGIRADLTAPLIHFLPAPC